VAGEVAVRAGAGRLTVDTAGRIVPAMTDVRDARPEDAPALASLHIAAWRAAYRSVMPPEFLDGMNHARLTERWRGMLGGPGEPAWIPERVLVVEASGGPLAGFAMLGPERAPEFPDARGELWAINIAPERWGGGLGRLLLQAAEHALLDADYREVVLWVIETNERARRFYERAGWRADGAEKRDHRLGFPLHEVRYARRLGPMLPPR
jgi:ribosomal protein S18 acetylase RimI-like enzyme